MIFDLFSKRQKRTRGEVPDIYQYDIIPSELRVQIVHIWTDVFGQIEYGSFGHPEGSVYEAYRYIHYVLCREYGVFTLEDGQTFKDQVWEFLINTEETERVIDIIEFSFLYIDKVVRDRPALFHLANITPDKAIEELNYRFREHGLGYQYESGQIIKVDDQFIHSEVAKPTLLMLSDHIYEGANEEFRKAHEHCRKRDYKECINNCLKAFESCMKAICAKRGWQYDNNATASSLIDIIFDNGLIPSHLKSHYSGLIGALKSGVPTVRNKQTGHGQGTEVVNIPEFLAAHILHLTASNILFLAKADEEMSGKYFDKS